MSIRRYMSIVALIDTLRQQQLAVLNPESWDDRNDQLFMRVYKSLSKAGGLYGACLVLKRQPLEAYLDSHQPEPGTKIRYSEVKYLKLAEVKELSPGCVKDLPFLKRYGFKDENEYRIVIETDSEQQPAIFISCPHAWIDTIYLNPWLYKNQVQSLIKTIKEIPGCERLKVKRSQLTDSATWREAADRIAGKTHNPALTLAEAGKHKSNSKRSRSL
ncbi:hypothetical protein [Martelella radicis]|uniref:Uncharacterized protein n=1 Tax=Martelella radicis TaxID=1397476 RepID=A0A7W6PCH6_9HYPH|nr:hypothetical protein [Martelella radicis]MBB4123669.1 hypothetical protein [Martelella radicis]